MTVFDKEEILDSFSILVDTREQHTGRSERRYKSFGVPYARAKLDYGDYAYQCVIDGAPLYDSDQNIKCPAVVERKMNLDELAQCFTRGRRRFKKEFERAKDAGARIYLLVENASWEALINGKYRSKFHPAAFIASILAWQARYDMRIVFCKSETSGQLIKEILYRELKERIDKEVVSEA